MHRRALIATFATAVICLLQISVAGQTTATTRPTTAPALSIIAGSSSFVFTDKLGDPEKPITVWTWAPDDLSQTTPIVFVMHGTLRNGETYRNNWIEHAKAKHLLLIVPEFSRQYYPGTAYSDGNMFDRAGKPIDPSRWAFCAIEHLFDEVKRITGNRSVTYFLYGHSAGGQLVERFVLFMPSARYSCAIAANPGWYTLPDEDKPFPAGLKNTPTTDAVLRRVIGRKVILMLGEKDTNPDDPELPKNPDAMAEGPYRFARGQLFFKALQSAGARLKVPLGWQLKTVPGAGHSDRQMSTAAADLLLPAPQAQNTKP